MVRTADVTGSDQLMTSSVLHVRCGAEVRQYMIHVTRQGQWRLADTDISFATLVDLIAYYCEPSRCMRYVIIGQGGRTCNLLVVLYIEQAVVQVSHSVRYACGVYKR